MDGIKNTSARLRRTFRYPNDEDTTGEPADHVMDVQEQEGLIRQLAEQNARRNSQFRTALLALPLASTLPYLRAFFRSQTRVLAVLALTSLASTAFILHALPPGTTGISPLDRWNRLAIRSPRPDPTGGDHATPRRNHRQLQAAASLLDAQPKPPLQRYLPYLNLALCALTLLLGRVAGGGDAGAVVAGIGPGNLPLVVYGVVLVAKIVMGGVDPETELATLVYDYEGA